MSKLVSRPPGRTRRPRRRLSAASLTVIVLALMMAYSIALLWLGLSVAATSLLATALAAVTVEVVRRVANPAGSATPSPTGRAIRAAAQALASSPHDAAEGTATADDDG